MTLYSSIILSGIIFKLDAQPIPWSKLRAANEADDSNTSISKFNRLPDYKLRYIPHLVLMSARNTNACPTPTNRSALCTVKDSLSSNAGRGLFRLCGHLKGRIAVVNCAMVLL
jgi:hypothetical protein